MAIFDTMRDALAETAVKYMGTGNPVPKLEFVMSPKRRADAIVESRINDPEMVMHDDGSWSFRGVPIRESVDVSNWTLSEKRKTQCGECHLKSGEICDICGARSNSTE